MHSKEDELENGHCTQACIFIKPENKKSSERKYKSHGTPHECLSHIEFPYYQEGPLTKEKIIDEILYYVKALCISEYYSKDHRPTKVIDEPSLNVDFESKIDWNNFNLSEYVPLEATYQTLEKKAAYTPSPFFISVATLWEIGRIQEICKNESDLIHYLSLLDSDDFKLLNDEELVVYKIYKVESDDNESVSSYDSDES